VLYFYSYHCFRWKEYAVKKLFFSFSDAEHNGFIDRKDIRELLHMLGVDVPDCSIPAMMSILDPDCDGRISWAEYDGWWDGIESHRIFCSYDKDNSGDIDKRELKNIAKDLGLLVMSEDIKLAFNLLDKKGTKHITFEEFLPWWMLVTSTKSKNRKKPTITEARSASKQRTKAPEDSSEKPEKPSEVLSPKSGKLWAGEI
jgi:Ca2+-binding EF-hand superfamily protein